MKRLSVKIIILLGIITIMLSKVTPLGAVSERDSFGIPLAIVVAYFDRDSKKLSEVLVKYHNDMEGWTISFTDDRYIKDTKNKTREHVHIERRGLASSISPFEAEVIYKVLKSFEKTLNVFSTDLEKERWGRILYLDGRFPLFLFSFYNLLSAAVASYDEIPKSASIDRALFEDSFSSPLSDKRVNTWKKDSEHILKLRIAAKELSFQSKKWREESLKKAKLNVDSRTMINFGKAFALFMKLYFNT